MNVCHQQQQDSWVIQQVIRKWVTRTAKWLWHNINLYVVCVVLTFWSCIPLERWRCADEENGKSRDRRSTNSQYLGLLQTVRRIIRSIFRFFFKHGTTAPCMMSCLATLIRTNWLPERYTHYLFVLLKTTDNKFVHWISMLIVITAYVLTIFKRPTRHSAYYIFLCVWQKRSIT